MPEQREYLSSLREPGFGLTAVAELERCHKAGATGVVELSDKGRGLGATSNALDLHIDNPRLDPILEKCTDLVDLGTHCAIDTTQAS
jgi:hypothetical protein